MVMLVAATERPTIPTPMPRGREIFPHGQGQGPKESFSLNERRSSIKRRLQNERRYCLRGWFRGESKRRFNRTTCQTRARCFCQSCWRIYPLRVAEDVWAVAWLPLAVYMIIAVTVFWLL